LTAKIKSGNKLKQIIDITRKNVYEACEVLEVKVAGYEVLGGLLEEFITIINKDSSKVIKLSSYQTSTSQMRIFIEEF